MHKWWTQNTFRGKNPPNSLENYGLETIWRLRNETFRRTQRLLISFYYFLKGYINNDFKKYIANKFEIKAPKKYNLYVWACDFLLNLKEGLLARSYH